MTPEALIAEARALAGAFPLSGFKNNVAANVACALVTDSGALHTGVDLVLACGIGFCAEHAAIASMLKTRETRVDMIVAVSDRGTVLPPCGRCRELLAQVDVQNIANTRILVSETGFKTLCDLLPDRWVDR